MASAAPAPEAAAAHLSSRTILITDLVDSTALIHRLGDRRAAELFARHERLARDLMLEHRATEIDKTDGFLILFDSATAAVRFALAYHAGLRRLAIDAHAALNARVGIHHGGVVLRANPAADVARGAKPMEVEGIAKHLAARVMSLAMGGQTLLSRAAFDLARADSLTTVPVDWMAHGSYRVKGIEEGVEVFEVGEPGVAPLRPPDDSDKARRVDDDTVTGWRPAPGSCIPGRDDWRLLRKLGEGGFGEVWQAAHAEIAESRVFKFCFRVDRLRPLKREVTVLRLLRRALGNRPDIARLIDWNLDEPPFYIESEYADSNLPEWIEQCGGFAAVPLVTRLELAAQVATSLAAAHSVGVLHKDVKPANVLVGCTRDNGFHCRLTDFGIGALIDAERIDAGITLQGMTHDDLLDSSTRAAGTRLYMAPEVIEGRIATIQADLYSLGVMLYQLVVGDFGRAIAPGWERDITDPLLREDIARLVDGSVERRSHDASQVADQLRSLEGRREQLAAATRQRIDARNQRRRSARRRSLAVVAVAGLIALTVGLAIHSRTIRLERDKADQARSVAEAERLRAEAVGQFLKNMLKGIDPQYSRLRDPTMREVLDLALVDFERQTFADPDVEVQIRLMLGESYLAIADWSTAERMLRGALLRLTQIGRGACGDAVDAHNLLGRTSMGQDHLIEALTVLDEGLGIARGAGLVDAAAGLRLLETHATVLARLERIEQADLEMQQVVDGWTRLRGADDPATLVAIGSRAAVLCLAGPAGEAPALLTHVADRLEAIYGPDHLQVIRAREALATAEFGLDRIPAAIALQREVVRATGRLLGSDHPEYAEALRRLGSFLNRVGAFEESEAALRDALRVAEQSLGGDSLSVANVLRLLFPPLMARGAADEAEAALVRARTILAANDAADGRALFDTVLNDLGQLLLDTERLEEAETVLREALERSRAGRGEKAPETLVRLENLGNVIARRGRLEETREILAQVLALRREVLPPGHPRIARTLYNQSVISQKVGDADGALAQIREAFEHLIVQPGSDPLVIRAVVGRLTDLLLQREDWRAVIDVCGRVVAAIDDAGIADPLWLGAVLMLEAQAAERAGDLQGALTALEAADRRLVDSVDVAVDAAELDARRGEVTERLARIRTALAQGGGAGTSIAPAD